MDTTPPDLVIEPTEVSYESSRHDGINKTIKAIKEAKKLNPVPEVVQALLDETNGDVEAAARILVGARQRTVANHKFQYSNKNKRKKKNKMAKKSRRKNK